MLLKGMKDGYWKGQNMLLSWAQRCGAEVRPLGRTKYGAVQCRRLAVHSITTVANFGLYY